MPHLNQPTLSAKDVQMTFRCSHDFRAALKAIAEDRGMKLEALIVLALRKQLKVEEA